MNQIDIARAWKDEDYRNSLTAEERASLPANPAGVVELSDEDMSTVTGGCCCGTTKWSTSRHHFGIGAEEIYLD